MPAPSDPIPNWVEVFEPGVAAKAISVALSAGRRVMLPEPVELTAGVEYALWFDAENVPHVETLKDFKLRAKREGKA